MFIKDSNERIQGRGGWSNYLFLLFNNKFILKTGKWRDPYHFSLTTTTHSSKQSEPLLVIFGGGGGGGSPVLHRGSIPVLQKKPSAL